MKAIGLPRSTKTNKSNSESESLTGFHKMSVEVNYNICRGWHLEYWSFGEYIALSHPNKDHVLHIYETGEVKMVNPLTSQVM